MTLFEILKKDGIEVEREGDFYIGKTSQGKEFFLEKDSKGQKFNLIIKGIGQKTRCNLNTVRVLLKAN